MFVLDDDLRLPQSRRSRAEQEDDVANSLGSNGAGYAWLFGDMDDLRSHSIPFMNNQA